eukprot:Sdes_comp20688_c0_seq1m16223
MAKSQKKKREVHKVVQKKSKNFKKNSSNEKKVLPALKKGKIPAGTSIGTPSAAAGESSDEMEFSKEDELFFGKSLNGINMFETFQESDLKIVKTKESMKENRKQNQKLRQSRKNIYDSDYESSSSASETESENIHLYENENIPDEQDAAFSDDSTDSDDFENENRSWKEEPVQLESLPIKNAQGILKYTVEKKVSGVDAVDSKGLDHLPEAEMKDEDETSLQTLASEGGSCGASDAQEPPRNRKLHISKSKEVLSEWATSIMASPQKNISFLKHIRKVILNPAEDMMVVKLAMMTLVKVFRDIIPNYRIRVTEENENVKVSKEVQDLRKYEEELLRQYKLFLTCLDNLLKNFVSCVSASKKRWKKMTTAKRTEKNNTNANQFLRNVEKENHALANVAFIACKCLCELLVNCSSFNFRLNLIATLVPLLRLGVPEGIFVEQCLRISECVCEHLEVVFESDLLGETSLECVMMIAKLVKSSNYKIPPRAIQVLLSIKISEEDIQEEMKNMNPINNHKLEVKKHLSKKNKKKRKEEKEVETEMKLASAKHDSIARKKFLTDITKNMFLIYFRILKNASSSRLLPPVLEGLSRHAHLINVEFFSDLMDTLRNLVSSGALSVKSSLHCILTAFQIVSGQGQCLNLDFGKFYTCFYTLLMDMCSSMASFPAAIRKSCASSTVEEDIVQILIKCLQMMIRNRKQISAERIAAFVKRLLMLSLFKSHNSTIAILSCICSMIHHFPRLTNLLENEAIGCGLYRPDVEDPEVCNAFASILWELHLLQAHYHPVVRELARYVSELGHSEKSNQFKDCALFLRKSPATLLDEYSFKSGGFNPILQPPQKHSYQKQWEKTAAKAKDSDQPRPIFLPPPPPSSLLHIRQTQAPES